MYETLPQASFAAPPPLLDNQFAIAPLGSFVPLHSIVNGLGLVSQVGLVVSTIVTLLFRLLLFPQSSVTVNLTSAVPVAPQSLLKPV